MSVQVELQPETETLTGSALYESVRDLWVQWRANPNNMGPAEELVEAYRYLVDSGVQRIFSRLPSHVNREELYAAGLEALYFSLDSCDPEMGASFEGYARKKIHGAIMDLLRCLDGVPRNSRKANRQLNSANMDFRSRNGRTPCQEELAEELDLSADELRRLEKQARTANRLSLDASLSTDSSNDGDARSSILAGIGIRDNPLEHMIDAETREALVAGLESLPERYRAVLVLHYNEGIRFNEIAVAMGVSEARISQIHSSGLEKLREFLMRS